jgi:hypothetical protein
MMKKRYKKGVYGEWRAEPATPDSERERICIQVVVRQRKATATHQVKST